MIGLLMLAYYNSAVKAEESILYFIKIFIYLKWKWTFKYCFNFSYL